MAWRLILTDVAKRLNLEPNWAPLHSGDASCPLEDGMPPLSELTDGLEAMIG